VWACAESAAAAGPLLHIRAGTGGPVRTGHTVTDMSSGAAAVLAGGSVV
jgi:hypothetical protein